jgi:chromosome segregation ATPase
VVKDAKGVVILTKRFNPARTDKFTGQVESTGFTPLTDEEYKLLNENSMTFTVYRDKHKLLVEHDELPPEAKTPHEALIDARREARKAAAQITALNDEIVKLKAELLDAEKRCKDLFDASGSGKGSAELAKELEAVKKAAAKMIEANSKRTNDLKKDNEALETSLAKTAKERDALQKENGDIKAALEKAGKGGKGEESD